tara:strand:+ start:3266 stop:9454 length:6189 start_codon:yes stop_codon:yes gene_type:complete
MPIIYVTDPETGEQKLEYKEYEEKEPKKEQKKEVQPTKKTSFVDSIRNTLEGDQLQKLPLLNKSLPPRMVINAGINALQEGSDTIRDIGGYFGVGEGTTAEEPDKPIIGMGGWKPQKLKSSGGVEDFVTGVLQFGLEWVTLSKALKVANLGLKGTKLGTGIATATQKAKKIEKAIQTGTATTVAKTLGGGRKAQKVGSLVGFGAGAATNATLNPKGLIVDFAGFDQYEGRLFDLATNTPYFSWLETIPLVQDLKSNPNDKGLQGRLKNMLEGWGIDFGIGAILKGIRGKWLIEDLANLKPGTKEYVAKQQQIETVADELAAEPSFQRIQNRLDRAAFDKSMAHIPPEQRNLLWERARTAQGKSIKFLDIDGNEAVYEGRLADTENWTGIDEALDLEEGFTWKGDDIGWVDSQGRPVPEERIQQVARKLEEETIAKQAEEERLVSELNERTEQIAEGMWRGDIPVDEEIGNMIAFGKSYDEIIDYAVARKPKPFKGIDEAGRGLTPYRGAEKLLKRLGDKYPAQGIDREEVELAKDFINTIGRHMFDDVALSITNKIGQMGQFDFTSKLVKIRKKIIEEGELPRTLVHELWHSLSRYLPEKDLIRYKKEFKRAKAKWKKKATAEELKNFRRRKYSEANYRYVDIDEYFAENLTDAFFAKLDEGILQNIKGVTKGSDFIVTDSFQSLIYRIGVFFQDLWASIHASFGGPRTKKIFNDFLKQRNTKIIREHSLDFSKAQQRQLQLLKKQKQLDVARATESGKKILQEEGLTADEALAELKREAEFEKAQFNRRIPNIKARLNPEDQFLRQQRKTDLANLKSELEALGPEPPKPEKGKSYTTVNGKRKLTKEAIRNRNWNKKATELKKQIDEIQDQQLIDQTETTKVENEIKDEQLVEETKRQKINEPGVSRWEATTGEKEGLKEDFLKALDAWRRGELKITDSSLWDDVMAVKSPTGKKIYGPEVPEIQILWDAISHRLDRIISTGLPSVNTQELLSEAIEDAARFGVNAEDIFDLNKGLARKLADNVTNVKNLLKLRIGVQLTSQETAKAAQRVLNEANINTINYQQAASELEASISAAVRMVKLYQTITRATGQLLATTQAQLPDLQGIKLTNEPTPNIKMDMTEIVEIDMDVFENFPPAVQEAMRTRNWTPEAKSGLNQIAIIAADADGPDGVIALTDLMDGPSPVDGGTKKPGEIIVEELKETPEFSLEKGMRTFTTYRVAQLLTAPFTWAVQAGTPIARMSLEPVVYAGVDVFSRKPKLNKIPMAALMYQRYLVEAYGALKLATKSFQLGQTLYDPGRRSSAWDLNNYKEVDKAHQLSEAGKKQSNNARAFDLNTFPLFQEIDKSSPATALDWLWRINTFDLRGQGSIETFQKALVGNSLLYTVGFEEGLSQAGKEGLKGIDAYHYAGKWAQAKVNFFKSSAVVNGETIADAVMKHPAAIQIGRMLTFTDDIRAKMGKRTFSYGQDLAIESGIDPKDFDAINEFAQSYKEGKQIPNKLAAKYSEIMRFGNKTLPAEGDWTPRTTISWSLVPSLWGRFQNMKHGYVATLIQPFNRSPGDITKQAIRMIPGGNLTVDSFYRDIFDENSYIAKHWKAEVATGATAIGLLNGFVFGNENSPIEFTGAGPLNPLAFDKWKRTGREPMSWRMRWFDENGVRQYGRWNSYRAFEPAATLIAGLADYNELSHMLTEDDRKNLGAGLVVQLGSRVLAGRYRSIYYQGIASFLDTVMGIAGSGYGRIAPEPGERSRLARGVQRFFTSIMPRSSHLRTIRQAFDTKKRVIPAGGERPIINPEGENTFFNEDTGLNINYDLIGTDNAFLNFGDQLLNEFKNATPGWSESLPPRTNWITQEPYLNAGFLGDEYMPTDDAPWLARMSSSFVLTAIPAMLDPSMAKRGYSQEGKNNYVMEEMLRLSGYGAIWGPPRPEDLQKGVTLSTDAYNRYKDYIAKEPHPEYGNMILVEALFHRMSSPDYQNPNLPNVGRSFSESPRASVLNTIIEDYKRRAKTLFTADPSNPYRLEVLIEEHKQRREERANELYKLGDPHPDEIRQNGGNTSEFNQKVNY